MLQAAGLCVEAPVTPTPTPQQTPKQGSPLPAATPKGFAKTVDSPALDKLRSLLKDHADSRAKTPTPSASAVGNKVCIAHVGSSIWVPNYALETFCAAATICEAALHMLLMLPSCCC